MAPRASAAVESDFVYLRVAAGAAQLEQSLKADGAEFVAGYGAFTLWKAPGRAAASYASDPAISIESSGDTLYLRGTSIDTRLREADTPSHGDQFWLVQFPGPIKDEWLDGIRRIGLQPVIYMPDNAYVVWGANESILQLETLPIVKWHGAYRAEYRLSGRLAPAVSAPSGLVDVTVQLLTSPATGDSIATLLAVTTEIHKGPSTTLGFTNLSVRIPAGELTALAQWPDVFNVEPWVAPVKHDEVQNQIFAGNFTTSGGNVVPSSPGYLAWLASKGFPTTPSSYPLVDVVDDGIDQGDAADVLHPDFHELGLGANPDRIAYIGNCTTDSSGNGVAGHGNLNVGIVGSYNDLTGTPHEDAGGYRIGLGMSPYGRLAGTKIFSNSGPYSISGCGNTDEGVVLASYNAGATLTSNSWGAPVGGDYDSSSQSYDALTRDASSGVTGNQEMLHVFSSGNDGPSSSTVGSPGTAKNVLTVGATENVRDQGVSDGCAISAANNADDMASFSSRGPTSDSRIKPDIVGPGTHVQGPASQDPGFNGTGVCGASSNKYYPAGQTLYTWSSGTSHSTPAAAGAASLIFNYYNRILKPGASPSPAMAKALVISSTRYINGTGGGGNLPTANQGFGDINLENLFDGSAMVLEDQETVFGATGDEHTVTGSVIDDTRPFRVTLVWTDAPGSTTGNAYVNNLDLEVTVGGNVYRGNVFSGETSVTGGSFDPRNNVESVFLPAGLSGPFSVRVIAANIAGDGVPGDADTTDQDFALVVDNGSTCLPIPVPANVTASGTGDNQISVAWDSSGSGLEYEVLRGRGSCDATFVVVATTSSTTYVDTNVSGGVTYAYRVRARQGECVTAQSTCATASTSGSCVEPPEFAGVVSAGNGAVPTCAIDLAWEAATPLCAGPVTYNVYRGTSPSFVPDVANRIATGVIGLTYADLNGLPPATAAYYIVRAVDAGNGAEDQNVVVRSAVPTGPIASASWSDDAGDTGTAAMTAGAPWTVSASEGHTGPKTYKTVATNNACGSLTSPPFLLGSGSQLAFWSKWFLDTSYGDKGVVEISTDGGATWARLEVAYPMTSSKTGDACALPAGKKYFTGINLTWTRFTASLEAYAGQTVQLRFRISTDGSPTGEFWWIDDLSVTDVQTPGPCTAGVAGLEPRGLTVDGEPFSVGTSDANGVLEPGEQVRVSPTWHNASAAAIAATGAASGLTGPAGATYTLLDAAASYGTIAAGADGDASSDPFGLGLDDPATRPAPHWDLTFTETLSTGAARTWTVHVGRSFTDVPTGHWAYRFVETIFHNAVTSGCGAGTYCPEESVTRAQMAVFLLMAEHGPAYVPPASTGTVFSDVPVDHWAGDYIEALATEGVTSGCGGGAYCPDSPINRGQMAVFLMVAEHGAAWVPPAATGTVFTDVPVDHWAAAYIEALASEGVTSGCGGGAYCPDGPVSRGQMAVFLTSTFSLVLYP